ncbi:(2Fe-2S)-binding protein [Oricola sp.]|uniref:(2Fe-2S)-binding protein n=1 Tax=Oricola sp. TaxID=1979950 RepID=UPI003BAB69D1
MKQEIEDVILDFLKQDAWQLITPGLVYHAMKKRGRCCQCFPNVIQTIIDVSTRYHGDLNTPEHEVIPFIQKIRDEHQRCETVRMLAREARLRQTAA